MWWIIVGFTIGLIETWYFGWNWFPQSNAERIWDLLSTFLIFIGVYFIVIKDIKAYIEENIRKSIIEGMTLHERIHHEQN